MPRSANHEGCEGTERKTAVNEEQGVKRRARSSAHLGRVLALGGAGAGHAAARLGAGEALAVAEGALAAVGVRVGLAVAAAVDVDPLDVLVAAEELRGLGRREDDVARAHDVLHRDVLHRDTRLRGGGGDGARVLLAAHGLGDRARDLGVAHRVRGGPRELALAERHARRAQVPRAVERDKLRRRDERAAVAHAPLRVLLGRVQERVHLERARQRCLCARRPRARESHSPKLGRARAVDHLVSLGWGSARTHTLSLAL